MPRNPRQSAGRPAPAPRTDRSTACHHDAGVLFAVYAPFGADLVLAGFPDETLRPIEQHPLIAHLKAVAEQGVHVAALIDLLDDDSWLVEIPAGRPGQMNIVSAWKQAMSRPQALSGFLRRAHARFPSAALVLALEGHGAGFLPEVDSLRITPASSHDVPGDSLAWVSGSGARRLVHNDGSPTLPVGGFEVLPVGGFEVLPTDAPEALPVTLPMSTWALAKALADAQAAGVPRPAVIHFNNCFNMSLEHLHTVAPYADVATGYANYNYFTSGSAYPRVFERLRRAGRATPLQLGRWFAQENHRPLALKGNHPGVGACIALKKVRALASEVEQLAQVMTAALHADRATHFPLIQGAVLAALQYDTQGDFRLEVPDQSTDLGTFMARLVAAYPAGHDIHARAFDVMNLLKGVQVYGDRDRPRMDLNQMWDFSDPRVAVSIFFPDPEANGLLDWRAPYYMAGAVDPVRPPALKAQVPFLADRAGPARAPWPEFLSEFHNVDPLPPIRLLQIPPFVFPAFDARFDPGKPPRPDDDPPKDPNDPRDPQDPKNPTKGR